MSYQLGEHASLHHKQAPVVSTKFITSISLLQLSSQELEQAVSQELHENPAFEVDEVPQCMRCGAHLVNGACLMCGSDSSLSHNGEIASESAGAWDFMPLLGGADEEDFDPMLRISSVATLEESLLQTLGMLLPLEDLPIAEALVGNLDSHGYLGASVEDIAEDLGLPPQRIEVALAVLQAQEPLGIGARDLSECLLIQLRWLRDQGNPYPLAERIAADYLRDVGEHRFVEIGRALGTTSTQVKKAWQFIKANLNPFPANAAVDGETLRSGSSRQATMLIRPDVIIHRTDMGFEAEVVEGRRFRLGISSSYSAFAAIKERAGVSDEDRKHIQHYVKRAQFFIDCLQQRWTTLKKIADALIETQYDFLDKGVRYLHPLTRSDLATYLGLHEATVSRATNGKYVLLPDGHLIPFDDFFDASLRTKDMLREMISEEDPHHPMSDEDLASQLIERGVPVARRTIAKYRESLKILPSHMR